jgi:hypothetical protein
MSYYLPEIISDNTFSALVRSANQPNVQVLYNGTGIHKYAGPVPMVTFDKAFNRSPNGELESITTTINLEGKIVRVGTAENVADLVPPTTGIEGVLGAISGLQALITGCPVSTLKIQCGTTDILNVSGVILKQFTANKSSDNWVYTADYNMVFEYNEPAYDKAFLVKNTSDSWTVEPIEESILTDYFVNDVKQKGEYHNPKVQPTLGANNQNTPTPLTGGASLRLDIKNIPQYRITRKVSAVGLPKTASCVRDSSMYLEAKKWVEARLNMAFDTNSRTSITGASGSAYFIDGPNPTINLLDKTFLYNHVRSTNFSISEGSYEVNEMWLAMPSAVKYVEDYNIDIQTDERYIKTVTVAGEIKGLSIVPFSIMTGKSGIVPDNSGKIDLSNSQGLSGGPFGKTTPLSDFGSVNMNSNISGNKYINALSGWLEEIKPYIYRRASFTMNSSDRNARYINPALTPQRPPNNPTYCYENLLNIIPISTTENHNPRKGSISYSYTFNNQFRFISGVLYENMSINDTGPADVINEAFVIGRRLGPVLQDTGAKTSTKKSVTFDIRVIPPSSINGFFMTNKECPLWTGGFVYTTINGIMEGLKPFGNRQASLFGNMTPGGNETRTGGMTQAQGQVYVDSNTENWNPTEGTFSRAISWTYQQCTNEKNWKDH